MAMSKAMLAALKALSYANTELDVKKNYKLERQVGNLLHPAIKPLFEFWDHRVPVGDHDVPVRIFHPKTRESQELLLFFHGGGWVTGNIDTYTATCASLADDTGRRVASVDYRLAPEFPFPCAVEDCYGVARELFLHSELLEAEPPQITLIGDSAGGNLAAVVSLLAADRGEFQVENQVLIYPATNNVHDETSPFPSIRENGENYLLTSKKICDYLSLYIQSPEDFLSPYFAPLLAEDLSGQPRTLVITAQFDPLRDEGEEYGRRLKAAGCEVELYRFDDMLHGFFTLPLKFGPVRLCHQVIESFLDRRRDSEK